MSVAIEEMAGAMQGRVTGVIIPPPEIRAVADKTAQFVARNGKSFEQKILGSADGKTAKFNFMKVMDPYHAYYEMKIKEFEEGTATVKLTQPDAAPAAVETNAELVKPVTTVAKASVQNPLARFTANKLTDPPPGYQFMMNHPKGISQVDVDIIRLTARFTAVNGREFLSGLAQREQRNPQFDFLKPTHMLFSYFTSFVDAYAKIIAPSTDMIKRIIKNTDRMNILEEGVQRWEWNRLEDDRKKKEQSDAEADRSANQSIDWYDFQVVETIDFGENDLLEMVDIAALNPYADRSQARDLSTYTDGMDMVPPPPPPPAEEGDMDIDMEGIRVVSDYTPRIAGNRSKVATMVDPISGKAIPVSDLSEHMRVQLMDPKWREQQQRFLNKQKDTGFAEGASIADSLKNFARQRGDIFSTADEDEAAMLEEHRKKQRRVEETNQVIWDGHQSTLAQVQQQKSDLAARMPAPVPDLPSGHGIGPSAPPPPAPYGAMVPPMGMYGIPPPPQPMMPPLPMMPQPMMGMPMMAPVGGVPYPPMPQGYMGMGMPSMMPSMPSAQYDVDMSAMVPADQKSVLVPEREFAARYPYPISIHISIPGDGDTKFVTMSISVTSKVKDLKDALVEQTGIAANKQQIKYMGAFLKDPQTFAAVNIGDGVTVEMIGRSRGGKR